MYITWKYDQFPFELCGKVTENKGSNLYAVEGFTGMQFEAKRKIKDDALGHVIKEKLNQYSEEYRKELSELNIRHTEHVAFMLTYMVGIK